MDSSKVSLADAAAGLFLGENARAVGETIDNGRIELAQHHTQSFFELIVDNHMLVDAKQAMRKLIETLNGKVNSVLPLVAV